MNDGFSFKDLLNKDANAEQPPVSSENNRTPVIKLSKGVDIINLENIDLAFKTPDGGRKVLFDKFNLDIKNFDNGNAHEIVSLMGSSGCGKSTILNLIAGLIKPDSGTIKIHGKPITEKQSVPMVFQQYSSFPWRTVIDNIALPLELKGISKDERIAKSMELLKLVGLEEHANKWVNRLSGGQQQRVAIARALNCDSKILLLDEATSGLDIKMKKEVENILLKIYYTSSIEMSLINVGHNVEENVYLSNRIYILTVNPHTTVYKTIDIDLGERRTSDIVKSPEFHRYVDEIDTIMNEI